MVSQLFCNVDGVLGLLVALFRPDVFFQPIDRLLLVVEIFHVPEVLLFLQAELRNELGKLFFEELVFGLLGLDERWSVAVEHEVYGRI